MALFCPRQNVEFRPAFLLVLPNTHFKHRCRRVSRLCDVSDVKTAGKPHPTPRRNHGVLAMLGREKAKHPLPVQRVVVYLLALSRASVFNVTPIMSLWASRVRGRAVTRRSARSECGSDQMRRAYSRADGAAPGDRIRGALRPRTAGRNSLKSGRQSMRLHFRCTAW